MKGFRSFRTALESTHLLLTAKILVALLLAWFAAAFLYITVSRIGYPFGLEWLEGAVLVQVHRLLSGQPLYVKPSIGYVPLLYAPLYFYVAALMSQVVGPGFFALRMVSLLATFGCVGMTGLIVRRRSGSIYVSLMAAGSFFALFQIGGSWFDIARVDMLALFLMMSALYFVNGRSNLDLALAGLVAALALLTKQSYWIVFVPFLSYAFAASRGRSWIVLASSIITLGATHLWLNWLHQGWYSFYVYKLAFGLGPAGGRGVGAIDVYWNAPVAQTLPIVFLLFALYLAVVPHDRIQRMGLLALAGGLILLSWSGINVVGGWKNTLIPSYAIFVIFAWLMIHELLQNPKVSNALRSLVLLLYCAQLAWLLYPVSDQIPSRADLLAGQALVQEIGRTPGDVLIPYDNYLALYAGKPPFLNYAAWGDLDSAVDVGSHRLWRDVTLTLRKAIRERQFDLIVLDGDAPWSDLQPYYLRSEISYSGDAFMPVTGAQGRPTYRFAPPDLK